jgi:hypothetical protein
MKNLGECAKLKKHFIIKINKDIKPEAAIDALLHEWAHARAWNHLHDVQEAEEFYQKIHDAAWGVAYAEVYKVWEDHYCN